MCGSDSDKKWGGKELLRDSIVDVDGIDASKEVAYGRSRLRHACFCEFLRRGEMSPVQFISTCRIIAISSAVPGFEDADEIDSVELIERSTDRRFRLFRPVRSYNAVDFDRSTIDPWPENSELRPWHDPRGRMFLEPAIDWDSIPQEVDAFRLGDWPGVSNIVVSETYKRRIEEVIEDGYISFRKLSM